MSISSQTAQWVCIVALALAVGLQRHELVSQRRYLLQEEPASPFAAGEDVRQLREQMAGMQRAFDGRVEALQAEVAELQAGMYAEGEERRRAQGAEPEPEPAMMGEFVRILKPKVVRCGGPGADTVGYFDMSRCADHVFQQCHRKACIGYNGDHSGGHRRAQSADSCDMNELAWRTEDINAACCEEDENEDCSGGYPHTCNADCARLFLSFWDECRSVLGKDRRNYEAVVELCEQSAGVAPSLAEQLNVQCSDGTAAEECVPTCMEDLHGALMLLNIEGHDSKFACELRHGLYSWVGPAVRFPNSVLCTTSSAM